MSPTEVRLKLRSAGFSPLPLNGKKPTIDAWQNHHDVTDHEIELWARAHPAAQNTGILTRTTPVLDIDILDPQAAQAVEDMVRDRFEEHGYVLARFGRSPRRAIPFRTNAPFAKIKRLFGEADTPENDCDGLELLCDGQQIVVHGVHPATHQPYSWAGGDAPGKIRRDDLPYIHEEEARALVDDATKLLIEKFGYRLKPAKGPAMAPRPVRDGGAYARAALEGEISAVASTRQGERNDRLNIAALKLGHLVGAGALSASDVESGLYAAAIANGLAGEDERAVRATIRSGLSAGIQQPRDIGGPQTHRYRAPGPPQDEPSVVFTPTPFVPTDPSLFPRRQILYGRHYARRYVSTTVSAPDVGKTTLALAEAVAMASNTPLLGVRFKGPLKVWYWNGEDPREETERRVLAILKHHLIKPEAIRGNLFLDSGRDMKLIVAKMAGRDVQIAVPVKEALTKALKANRIDVLIVDPFVKTHRVEENANALMDEVVTVFAEIAEDANCSVELVQHARKTGGNEVTLEDARGASAIVAAARMGRVANRMAKQDGELIDVAEDQCRFHVRIDTARSSMAPPPKATWIKLVDVGLGNVGPEGEDEDHVQAAVPWKWPDPFAGTNVETLREVQRRTREKPRRKDMRSPDWIGYLIIETVGLDRNKRGDRARAKTMFETWLKQKMFKTVIAPDKKGEDREFVEVDQFASD
jgi:hypothetical protein